MPNKYLDPHPWTLAQIKQIGGRLVGLCPQCWWPLDDHSGVIFAATPPECRTLKRKEPDPRGS